MEIIEGNFLEIRPTRILFLASLIYAAFGSTLYKFGDLQLEGLERSENNSTLLQLIDSKKSYRYLIQKYSERERSDSSLDSSKSDESTVEDKKDLSKVSHEQINKHKSQINDNDSTKDIEDNFDSDVSNVSQSKNKNKRNKHKKLNKQYSKRDKEIHSIENQTTKEDKNSSRETYETEFNSQYSNDKTEGGTYENINKNKQTSSESKENYSSKSKSTEENNDASFLLKSEINKTNQPFPPFKQTENLKIKYFLNESIIQELREVDIVVSLILVDKYRNIKKLIITEINSHENIKYEDVLILENELFKVYNDLRKNITQAVRSTKTKFVTKIIEFKLNLPELYEALKLLISKLKEQINASVAEFKQKIADVIKHFCSKLKPEITDTTPLNDATSQIPFDTTYENSTDVEYPSTNAVTDNTATTENPSVITQEQETQSAITEEIYNPSFTTQNTINDYESTDRTYDPTYKITNPFLEFSTNSDDTETTAQSVVTNYYSTTVSEDPYNLGTTDQDESSKTSYEPSFTISTIPETTTSKIDQGYLDETHTPPVTTDVPQQSTTDTYNIETTFHSEVTSVPPSTVLIEDYYEPLTTDQEENSKTFHHDYFVVSEMPVTETTITYRETKGKTYIFFNVDIPRESTTFCHNIEIKLQPEGKSTSVAIKIANYYKPGTSAQNASTIQRYHWSIFVIFKTKTSITNDELNNKLPTVVNGIHQEPTTFIILFHKYITKIANTRSISIAVYNLKEKRIIIRRNKHFSNKNSVVSLKFNLNTKSRNCWPEMSQECLYLFLTPDVTVLKSISNNENKILNYNLCIFLAHIIIKLYNSSTN